MDKNTALVDFTFEIVGAPGYGPTDDNTDVQVTLANGSSFVATFFTLQNIQRLMDEYKKTGECNHGAYFWATDMIVVRKLTEHEIENTVADLIKTGEFEGAFCALAD